MIVLVRNLRVAVILIRDAVVIVIRIRHIRRTVTISIQLELSRSLILGTVRVSHRNRNIELLNGVLAQLRLIRERNSDLTSGLVNRDNVTLRSLEITRNRELRTLRSLRLLAVLIRELRGRLSLLTRNNQLLLVGRGVLVGVLRYQNSPCGDVVTARDDDDIEDIALLCIRGDVEGACRDLSLDALGLVKFARLEDFALLVAPFDLRGQARQFTAELRGHLGARSCRLVGCVVVSLDRHRSIRHQCVTDVVERVHGLVVARGVQVFNPRGDGLVFSRNGVRRLEVTTSVEALEDRGVEAGVTVLDDTILVLNPNEHVVRVEEVLTGLVLVGVVTETQRIVARRVSLAVDRLEDVLGVSLEHLLGLFGQLVGIVLELCLQLRVRRSTVLGEGRGVYGVAIGGRVLSDGVALRTSCGEAPVRAATGFEPYLARKDI